MDITIRAHGDDEYQKAIQSSEFLFGNTGIDFLNRLSADEVLGIFEGVPNFSISIDELKSGINITDLLAANTSVFPSKGEAKKMILGGGVAINKNKVNSPDDIYDASNLIAGKFIVTQKGKKNYFLIVAE